MASLFNSVVCMSCGHQMAPDPMLIKCEACGGMWIDAAYDYKALRWEDGPPQWPLSLWRYSELLPLTDATQQVSLGEGWTPIIRADRLGDALGHEHLFIKDERRNPTNSFKDRQGALSVSVLKQHNIKECVLASTGNAAAAYAAYCARAGIKLWLFLPSMVPSEKMRELGLYGAEVIKVTGTYDQTKAVAADFAARRGLYFDRGARGIPGKESMKTLAYEIAEHLALELAPSGRRWLAPDWYIQAVSGGIGPLGVLKGFKELYSLGLIDKIPKLGIVQVAGCSPMVQAFEHGQDKATPVVPETLITVLATGDPGHTYTLLREAILEYGGGMVSVDDGQAFRAMRRLARTEGLSVEPATSVAFAGLEKLIALGHIHPEDNVLINCSGHTFPAEKHILEDQYVFDLELGEEAAPAQQMEGLEAALERLDERITTVVVIDDNPHDTRLIRRLLQGHKNYRVFETNNPLDGLDLVLQRKPDLVITDLTMPELDGFSLLEQLKINSETSHIPVIVLSGKTLDSSDRGKLEGRIDSVWLKGHYSTRDLVDHVVETLKDRTIEALPPTNSSKPVTIEPVPSTSAHISPETSKEPKSEDNGVSILVVDDNPQDSRLVRRILESTKRYRVTEAHSGSAALRAVNDIHPEMIILDMNLPDMTGLDVLEVIRNNVHGIAETKVAILSAKDLTENERQRLNLYGAVFWQKATLDRRQLIASVDDYIKKLSLS